MEFEEEILELMYLKNLLEETIEVEERSLFSLARSTFFSSLLKNLAHNLLSLAEHLRYASREWGLSPFLDHKRFL
jgi:hypothetical protein